jgi:gas vesicle protein GvpN
MTTVLQAKPRDFVSTPAVERVAQRALRYLQSGYSVHLKGAAGTGKTTLGLHLADLMGRPIMLIFGDDEFKTSDLIGNQTGYTRKKVVDNYIHSVMKVEDELRQNWVDSRLTLACREGFTLVYDEFNRSRPEVNNVLLSALEEKLLVLPPSGNRQEYVRVHPQFRAIFTSNPAEYCGVHGTQDALLDRLITINMPPPDELTQQQILVQKIGLEPEAALSIVRLVQAFQADTQVDSVSSLRPSLMIGTICQQHGMAPQVEDPDFRDLCADVLLDRTAQPLAEATQRLWQLFNQYTAAPVTLTEAPPEDPSEDPESIIFDYIEQAGSARLAEIEAALKLNRFQVVNALKSLIDQALITKQDSGNKPALYQVAVPEPSLPQVPEPQ